MEKEIEKLKIENKEKEDAIIELSQFYYVKNIKLILYFILQYIKNKSQNQNEPLKEENIDDDVEN